MNKDKVYLEGYVVGHAADTLDYKGLMVQLENLNVVEIDKNLVHEDINKPQPIVSQFVADWYEEHKEDFEGSLFRCIDCIPSLYEEGELNDFEEWVVDSGTKPFQTLVNMHQFGYTIEKENRYIVKLKGINSESEYLYYGMGSCTWRFREKNESGYFRKNHTRKELEDAGFGWVFDCPGIEIEEVEE